MLLLMIVQAILCVVVAKRCAIDGEVWLILCRVQMGREHGFPRGVIAHEYLRQFVVPVLVRCLNLLDLERWLLPPK